MTLEELRDETMRRIVDAGGVIAGHTALAHPDETSVVVAYQIHAGAPDPDTATVLAALRAETETNLTGLIPAMMEVQHESIIDGSA